MLLSKDLRVALGGKASSEKDGSGGESKEVRSQGIHQIVLGKIKGACFFTNIYPQIKEDTEMAKNAMPGREGPDNPLESTDDGNIRCKVVLLQLTLVPTLWGGQTCHTYFKWPDTGLRLHYELWCSSPSPSQWNKAQT